MQAALAHFPSEHCYANGAWTVIAALAVKLLRWANLIGPPGHTIAPPGPPTPTCSRSPAA